MGQGMDDKIRQIAQMLNSPEAQDGIRNLFSSLGTQRGSAPAETDLQEFDDAQTTAPDFSSLPQVSPDSDWIHNIQNMLSQVNSVQDSRVNLLHSVHPFLNPTRRERCSTCMNILKIAGILKAMTNSNGRLF
ncbi:MAG: hypothetical protein GX115_06035 [Ruminiclostridium sp.]|nr:hypothetical protein [Ruminiclostridium sp.]